MSILKGVYIQLEKVRPRKPGGTKCNLQVAGYKLPGGGLPYITNGDVRGQIIAFNMLKKNTKHKFKKVLNGTNSEVPD